MSLAQRILIIVVALIILVGGIITLISSTVFLWEYLAYTFILIIPTGLFYYAFSNSKKTFQITPKNKNQHLNIKGNIFTSDSDKDHTENKEKLANLTEATSKPLFKLSTVFPFDFFPSDIIIDMKKIMIVDRYFFSAARQYPILIKNMVMPIIETNLFFGSFTLDMVYTQNQNSPIIINYLKKNEALRARRIISGLMICDKEEIDLSHLTHEEVLAKVEELGAAQTEV